MRLGWRSSARCVYRLHEVMPQDPLERKSHDTSQAVPQRPEHELCRCDAYSKGGKGFHAKLWARQQVQQPSVGKRRACSSDRL